MSVAVLSPHLDDAVLSAWSVLRRRGPVRVVNVCAGVPPPGPPSRWDRLTRARDAAERMRERLAEDRAALARAGREAVYLDFLDHQYRAGPIDDTALSSALTGAVAGSTELWAPAGIGGHPDHVQVRDVALALRTGGVPAAIRLYAELPYSVRWGWPEWVSGRRSVEGLDIDAWLTGFLPEGTPAGERHVLSRAEARRKLRALRDYGTQWAALDAWTSGGIRRCEVIRYEASYPAPGRATLPTSGG